MNQDSKRISELWKQEYSREVSKYSQYQASEQFHKIASLFSPGKSYYYILNFHNLELDYISPDVEKFVGISPQEVKMEDLLRVALPEEIEVLENKEKVIKDFFSNHLRPEELTSYKIMYSYQMRDHQGEPLTILHQATVLSVAENGYPQHVLSIHTDISHLRVCSTSDVSFVHLQEGKSYYNINCEKGYFEPELANKKQGRLCESITKREKEVIRLLAKGYNAEKIAEELHVSIHTIKTHRKNVLQKSGCTNTTQLVAKCITGGVVSHQNL